MKWLLVLLFACHGSPPAVEARPPATCPAAGEHAEDCPWAAVARDAQTDAHAAIQRGAPAIAEQLARDAKAPAVLAAWGEAVDYNQAPGGGFGTEPIVALAIVDDLAARAGVAPHRDRVVHAGVQHTYGYLFSVLATPYGFKRARWVEPTINDGFRLPPGTIAPVPASGTLLGNVTWLAGAIAFAGEPELAGAHGAPALVAPAVQALDVSALQIRRLTETVDVAGRAVELRTDFVELPVPSPTASTLLIYSVRDRGVSRLITVFPINATSRDKYQGVALGEGVPITTQYNAWVDGLTGTKLTGRRTLR